MHEASELDYSIDGVLTMKQKGTIRIGLDIGGGSATFAARMSECNVTIMTTSMNFDGPFNSFIASRGLIPMHISVAYRLPFFDNTLDIVHSMHVLTTGYLIRCYNLRFMHLSGAETRRLVLVGPSLLYRLPALLSLSGVFLLVSRCFERFSDFVPFICTSTLQQ